MNMMRNSSRFDSLLQKLQEIDFAIYETALYLDAYPHSQEALNHYHNLLKARNELRAAYESEGKPLTMFGNESKTSWDWVKTPMPWEIQ